MTTHFATGIALGKDSFKTGLDAASQALFKMGKQKPQIAILFCSSRYKYLDVILGVKKTIGEQVPVVGCSSAGEFTEENVVNGGVACALIASDTHRFFSGMGTDIKNDQIQSVQEACQHFPRQVKGYPYLSAMLFVDGLAGKGEEAVLAAASVLGPMVKFSGGAAGDDLKFKKTYVFGEGQSQTNAISLCLLASQNPVIISVKHGHLPLSPPLRITKAKDNILYEIDEKPALEVWKYYLKGKAKEMDIDFETTKDPEEISRVLLKHEAGLLTGNEYKIRFPMSANPDGSLNFVCSMLEGAVIKIMDSHEQDQIESARFAAQEAIKFSQGTKLAGAIVFDCVCRSLLLKNKFRSAIEEIKKTLGNIPLIGFETYGEIAMEMNQLSGFHNATTVIMLIPD